MIIMSKHLDIPNFHSKPSHYLMYLFSDASILSDTSSRTLNPP
jgi:hypothetical protein